MLLEVLKQDKFLTATLIAVGIMWAYILLKNFWSTNKKANDFQQMYDHILHAKEHQVKGRFEE